MTAVESFSVHNSENVLVTGGGGFLGRAIIRRLIDRGDHVRSLSRNLYPELAAKEVDQIQGDIADLMVLIDACQNRDVVFHVAAKPPPWGKYDDYYQTNVVGTQNVIDACLYQKVPRLIHTSTPSVVFNGNHLEGVDESLPYPLKYNAHYPATKALAEQCVVKSSGKLLNTIILRPHEIWGPEDPHFVPRLLARAKKLKQIGDGKNLVDTTYVDNAADAHIFAADKLRENPHLSGNLYFISQGEPIPAWKMINSILNAAGLEPVKGKIPFRVAWFIGAVLEFFYKTFRLAGEPQMTRFLAEAVATSHWFDISAAKTDLGYKPRVSTEEGLQRLADWLKSEHSRNFNN
ncbi:MAG: NAD-dependent epimerase/dehydratase family protein [Desulfobacterales bacterium]|nr:NAD-dependent epimerase/dehydratase family protein [Desulfobacterales bacterium]